MKNLLLVSMVVLSACGAEKADNFQQVIKTQADLDRESMQALTYEFKDTLNDGSVCSTGKHQLRNKHEFCQTSSD